MLAWSLALFVVCVATNRWRPHLVSDSPSYLSYSFSPSAEMARQIRLPVYPLLLSSVEILAPSDASALQMVVVIQILLHAIAVSLLMIELQAWGTHRIAAITAAAAVAIGCSFWDNVSTIATDCLAMSIGVITATCVLRGWRIGFSIQLIIMLSLLTLIAIGLRPAYLFLLTWAVVMFLVRPFDAQPTMWLRRFRDVGWFVVVPIVVLLAWCGFRYQSAGDFSLLPFGHQNMAAVTTQLLDNDELERLPGEVGVLSREIAKRRVLVSRGGVISAHAEERTRGDGLDLRAVSDPAKRADSYMTLENRWDAMTYLVVTPAVASIAGNDILVQHRLLADLDRTIVRSYPLRYFRWWLLAIRRGIWGSAANIMMHPVFLIVTILVTGAMLLRCLRPQHENSRMNETRWTEQASRSAAGQRAFFLLAISYAIAKLSFIALTSPPIGRFGDAAFVFVPSLIAIWIGNRLVPRPMTT